MKGVYARIFIKRTTAFNIRKKSGFSGKLCYTQRATAKFRI